MMNKRPFYMHRAIDLFEQAVDYQLDNPAIVLRFFPFIPGCGQPDRVEVDSRINVFQGYDREFFVLPTTVEDLEGYIKDFRISARHRVHISSEGWLTFNRINDTVNRKEVKEKLLTALHKRRLPTVSFNTSKAKVFDTFADAADSAF